MSIRNQPLKAGEVATVLKKLGYRSAGKAGRTRGFTNVAGTYTSLPADPEELLHPQWLSFLLRDVGLTVQKFERMLESLRESQSNSPHD